MWFHRTYRPPTDRDLGDRHYLDTPTWMMLFKVLSDFRAAIRVHIGNGRATSFWFDHRLSHQPLLELFPATQCLD